MKTIEIPGYIHVSKESWMDEPIYHFSSSQDMASIGLTLVGPHLLTFEFPEGFDLTAALVQSLKDEKRRLADSYMARVNQINDEISKLQCLTYSGGHELAREAAERTGENVLPVHQA